MQATGSVTSALVEAPAAPVAKQQYAPINPEVSQRVMALFKPTLAKVLPPLALQLLQFKGTENMAPMQLQVTQAETAFPSEERALLSFQANILKEFLNKTLRPNLPIRRSEHSEIFAIFVKRALLPEVAPFAAQVRALSQDFLPNLVLLQAAFPALTKATVLLEELKRAPKETLEAVRDNVSCRNQETYDKIAKENPNYEKILKELFSIIMSLNGKEKEQNGLIEGLLGKLKELAPLKEIA